MRKLNFESPINSLSLGNVAINFLRELRGREIDLSIHPIGEQGDFSAYNKIQQDFKDWVSSAAAQRLTKLDKEVPTLKVWHISGSEKTLGQNQYLYTFYEVDSPTKEEVNIIKMQKHVFFSSSEAAQAFKDKGCSNVSSVPLGFDPDFEEVEKDFSEDTIHFGLIGKFERRKNTQALIQLWLKKYGNNPKYQLSCLIANPFMNQEQMQEALNVATLHTHWTNINFLPHLTTNAEVNKFMNNIDIDLSGLSNGEGWNLPAFNCTALGKWSIVSNCSSHKDWATEGNSILVEPIGKQPCYDNFFFKEGNPFNQGQYYKLDGKKIVEAMKKAEKKVGQFNTEGTKLRDKFTYSKTIDSILDCIYSV
jgi:hypothetical protein